MGAYVRHVVCCIGGSVVGQVILLLSGVLFDRSRWGRYFVLVPIICIGLSACCVQQTFIGGLCCGGGMMDHGGGMPVAWMWLGLCSAELPRDMVFISAAWGCA